MKAERRHQLKQNTLAHSLETLPDVSRRHGTKILVVVMVGLIVALLIRNRVTSARAQADQAAYWLSNGRDLVGQLRDTSERVPATQFISVAQEISKGVDQAVQQVLELSDDPKVVDEARLVQGDLNWELAAIPEPPGATTRPQLALPRSDEQLLQAAADAYQSVIADAGKAPKESVTSARLGLAAVYENQKKWDGARDQYQKVVDDPATAKPLKDRAAAALSRLQLIQKAPLIAAPATSPAGTGGTTMPTSAPGTAPTTGAADAKPQAAPATAPTAPATAPNTVPQPAPERAKNPG
jgi:hypothetical protein